MALRKVLEADFFILRNAPITVNKKPSFQKNYQSVCNAGKNSFSIFVVL